MACIIFFSIVLVFTVFLLIGSKDSYEAYIEPLDLKNYPLKKYIPIGLRFMDMIQYRYHTRYDQKLHRRFAELCGMQNADYFLRIHWASKVCYVLMLMLFLSFFGSFIWLQEAMERRNAVETALIDGNELVRPPFGEGSRAVKLNADVKKGERSKQQQYTISIPETAPPNDGAAVDKALERLTNEVIKGSNGSLDCVNRSLHLKNTYSELGNLGVLFEWKSSNTEVVAEDGSVFVPEDPQRIEAVTLTAVVSKGAVKKEKSFSVRVRKAPLTDEQIIAQVIEELERRIKEIGRGSGGINSGAERGDRIKLPTTSSHYGNVIISWFPKKTEEADSGLSVVIFALVMAGLIVYLLDNDINSRVDKRRMRIKYDFPDFLNKLLLLINAGMTVSRAMEKIIEDGSKDSPLYEELAAAISDINGGKPEFQAFEEFAGRCKIPEVSKFVSVLLQNLRKGNAEMVSILRLQSNACWEMRKSAAKRMGEEASTKLLLPLMLMLIAILMIVVMPAVLSMKGF